MGVRAGRYDRVSGVPTSRRLGAPVSHTLGTVLVVDDDDSLRAALESALPVFGYRTLCAATPESACSLLSTEPVDAVLLDIHLPTMSGPALRKIALRRWPELAGRIAFMTGVAVETNVRAQAELGGCPILRKPFTVRELTSWLDGAVRAPQSVDPRPRTRQYQRHLFGRGGALTAEALPQGL